MAAKPQSEEPYKYRPLQSVSETRVVTLLPGQEDEPLRVEIKHISLDLPSEMDAEPERSPDIALESLNDALPNKWKAYRSVNGRIVFRNQASRTSHWDPPNAKDLVLKGIDWTHKPINEFALDFEALSYVWGEEDGGEHLEVQDLAASSRPSGTSLYVRPLLAEALRDLRHEDRERVMWIDAISINQNDHVERNEQVHHMWKIFKYARRTIAWLGASANNSDVAITHLRDIASQVIPLPGAIQISSPEASHPTWHQPKASIPITISGWKAVFDLLDRPYFERLWVFSELSLAGYRTVVMASKHSIGLMDFLAAIVTTQIKDREPYTGIAHVSSYVYNCISEKNRSPFDDILTAAVNRECSDTRDKVYGVLSLASPILRQMVSVDYTATAEYVYRSIFEAILKLYGTLDYMAACRLGHRAIGGPTWVPDLSSKSAILKPHDFCSGFSACVPVSQTELRLQLLGRKLGTIKEIRERHSQSPWDAPLAWVPSDVDGSPYPTGQSRRDAYIATLRLGCLRQRWPDVSYPGFDQWKEVVEELLHDPSLVEKLSAGDPYDSVWVWKNFRFFTTEEGYYGIGAEITEAGDMVYCFLGCDNAVILRPTKDNAFQVVGNCHVHGGGDATVFLGPLPDDWTVQIRVRGRKNFKMRFVNKEIGEETVHDPRLGPLPEEWEWLPSERTRDDPMIYEKFRNKVTGEVMRSDPRMSPDALRARGVELEVVTLV